MRSAAVDGFAANLCALIAFLLLQVFVQIMTALYIFQVGVVRSRTRGLGGRARAALLLPTPYQQVCTLSCPLASVVGPEQAAEQAANQLQTSVETADYCPQPTPSLRLLT
jgi:hypothetical protein